MGLDGWLDVSLLERRRPARRLEQAMWMSFVVVGRQRRYATRGWFAVDCWSWPGIDSSGLAKRGEIPVDKWREQAVGGKREGLFGCWLSAGSQSKWIRPRGTHRTWVEGGGAPNGSTPISSARYHTKAPNPSNHIAPVPPKGAQAQDLCRVTFLYFIAVP